jgi:hypothetical protein
MASVLHVIELGGESPLVNQNEVAKYHWSMTGSANWAIALGRFDIHHCMTTFMRTDDHWKVIWDCKITLQNPPPPTLTASHHILATLPPCWLPPLVKYPTIDDVNFYIYLSSSVTAFDDPSQQIGTSPLSPRQNQHADCARHIIFHDQRSIR